MFPSPLVLLGRAGDADSRLRSGSTSMARLRDRKGKRGRSDEGGFWEGFDTGGCEMRPSEAHMG